MNLIQHACVALAIGGAAGFGLRLADHEPPRFPDYGAPAEAAAEPAADTPAGRGARHYQALGCVACHSTDGSARVGPSFQGLWGREVTASDGSHHVVDADFVRQSVREPQAVVTAGFEQAAMPPYPEASLSEQQLDELIAWLQTQR